VSGIWGALNYQRLAPLIKSHRGEGTLPLLVEDHAAVERDIAILEKNKSDQFISFLRRCEPRQKFGLISFLLSSTQVSFDSSSTASMIGELPEIERGDALKLVGLMSKKDLLYHKMCTEVRTMFWMRLWLYLHVPLAVGSLVALFIHVISMLRYW